MDASAHAGRRQRALNRSVAASRALFASHREAVMRCIDAVPTRPGATLCILGAGNCNDVELRELARRFARIRLVDLDVDAVERALARDGLRSAPTVEVHRFDVTGWSADPGRGSLAATDEEIDRRARTSPPGHERLGAADVVVSATILSQLTRAALDWIGETHPRAVELALAVRDAHLGLMVELLAPGGTAVLATDVASSSTQPLIAEHADAASLLRLTLDAAATFTGTDPIGIVSALTDGLIGARVEDVAVRAPWLWRLTDRRTHLVCAVTFRRRDEPEPSPSRRGP